MKNILAFFAIITIACSCGVHNSNKCDLDFWKDNARYWEKSRWMSYEHDSLCTPAFDIMINAKLGNISPDKALNEMYKLINKCHVPFDNTKQY
jgi:hypothetical protein